MKTVRILHGKYKDEKPQSKLETPDYIINELSELKEIIELINQ